LIIVSLVYFNAGNYNVNRNLTTPRNIENNAAITKIFH